MSFENPGSYDEARKRIRENKELESQVIEKKREDFEKGKERIRSRKKLDIFELHRRIETGHSLSILRSEIQEALKDGQISIDTYTNTLNLLHESAEKKKKILPQAEYVLSQGSFPGASLPSTQYFENQKL
jgi:hypothetical protein